MLGYEIGKWAEKNVTYGRLELGRHELTEADREEWPALRNNAEMSGSWPYDKLVKLPEPEGKGDIDS